MQKGCALTDCATLAPVFGGVTSCFVYTCISLLQWDYFAETNKFIIGYSKNGVPT